MGAAAANPDLRKSCISIDAGGEWAAAALARRDALVTAYMGLVDPIARRISEKVPPSFPLEDLIQAGRMGLIRGAARYRPCVVHPSVFLRKFIAGNILESVRRKAWHENTMDELPAFRENVVAMPAPEQRVDALRRKADLKDAIARLPLRERRVMEARLDPSEPSLFEVARRVARITHKRRMPEAEVSRLVRNATERLREMLAPAPEAA